MPWYCAACCSRNRAEYGLYPDILLSQLKDDALHSVLIPAAGDTEYAYLAGASDVRAGTQALIILPDINHSQGI